MPTARLPLNTLPTFRAVARLGNLRAAAEELHLTHSAVSQQIKLLEEQLGFALFDRRGRRIVLNPAGAALQAAAVQALDRLHEGVRSAAAVSRGESQRIRLSLLPSFTQRWLLPRMPQWRARHPDINLELHTSLRVVDLAGEGFHAALRAGGGAWPGLRADNLTSSPMVALGSPAAARRLQGLAADALAREPLLGNRQRWQRWFAVAGCEVQPHIVASFNDAGLMLQAAEQDIGIALARELLAADAMREGRLVRLSPFTLVDDQADAFWFVYPPHLADWPPLLAFRNWLFEELASSMQDLPQAAATTINPLANQGLFALAKTV